ncbi:phage tail tape measure protein [Streptomyces cinereoruber]|uniref:phage tail tape measure protein n=1 Tax=Streptomyces cinereoruber TaxID=67260 RepID=UPI00362ECF96
MTVLDELLVRIGMDSSGVDQGVQETTNRLDSLAGPAAAAGIAAGAVFAVGIAGAMNIAEAQHELKDSLSLTEVEAERAGGIAGDVFSDGFGESIGEVTSGLATVTQAMGKLGDFTDAELQDMTKSALGLAKRLEVDVADASTAAGQLIKQGLVKDGTEAFDVLTQASKVLPKSMLADVPAIVSEYGTHFKRIGLDAKTAFGMMAQYVQAGGKDIDQAGDVLHEFARITSEETDRAAEGFKGLGLDSKAMLKAIGQGGPAAAQALSTTITALRGVKDPAKQAQLGVQLFGDMAGESASALWAMDPASAAAASGMDKAAGSSKALTDSMAASPAQQMDAAMRTLQMTLGESFLPVVKKASEFFAEHKGTIKELVPIILVLVVTLGLMAAAVWIVNVAMMANPIGLVIAAVIALIAIVVILVMKWDQVKAKLLEYWEAIKAQAIRIWESIVGFFSDTWQEAKDQATRNWGLVRDFFVDLWNKIEDSFNDGIQWVKDLWASWDITGMIKRSWGTATTWVSDQWNRLVGAVSDAVSRIGRVLGNIWDGITSGLKAALNGAIYLINQGIQALNWLVYGANKIPGVSIPYIPYIPYLAEGGITTGPTLAMIGEGKEQEAVLPLSRLEALITTTPAAMAAPSTAKVQPVQVVVTARADANGFREFLQYEVATVAAGSVARYAGEE